MKSMPPVGLRYWQYAFLVSVAKGKSRTRRPSRFGSSRRMPDSKPDRVAAGLRHIVFENRGSEIHEGMLVRLPKGHERDDYVAAVKGGSLSRRCLGLFRPGTNMPGETVEIWLKSSTRAVHHHLLE